MNTPKIPTEIVLHREDEGPVIITSRFNINIDPIRVGNKIIDVEGNSYRVEERIQGIIHGDECMMIQVKEITF